MVQRSDQRRPAQFLILAVLLFFIGAGLQLSAVALWPWALYAIGAFVMVQAVVSWLDCMHAYCPGCLSTMTIWPWIK